MTDNHLRDRRKRERAQERINREAIGELYEYGGSAPGVVYERPGPRSTSSSLAHMAAVDRHIRCARTKRALVAIERSPRLDDQGKVVFFKGQYCNLHEDCRKGSDQLRRDCATRSRDESELISAAIDSCIRFIECGVDYDESHVLLLERMSGVGPPEPGTGVWRPIEAALEEEDQIDLEQGIERFTREAGWHRVKEADK